MACKGQQGGIRILYTFLASSSRSVLMMYVILRCENRHTSNRYHVMYVVFILVVCHSPVALFMITCREYHVVTPVQSRERVGRPGKTRTCAQVSAEANFTLAPSSRLVATSRLLR